MHGPAAKLEYTWIQPGQSVRHGTYENNEFRIRYKPVRKSGAEGEPQEAILLKVLQVKEEQKQEL